MKDAYYFSHDSNAKDDIKITMLIEEMGLEGYGIFWVLVESLRDQPNYKYPVKLLPSLARKYNSTFEKMKAVVLRYGLFNLEEVTDGMDVFFSNSLNRRMSLREDNKMRSRIAGVKGNLIRYGYLTKAQANKMNATELINFNNRIQAQKTKEKEIEILEFSPPESGGDFGGESYPVAIKEKKGKERKEKEIKGEDKNSTKLTPLNFSTSISDEWAEKLNIKIGSRQGINLLNTNWLKLEQNTRTVLTDYLQLMNENNTPIRSQIQLDKLIKNFADNEKKHGSEKVVKFIDEIVGNGEGRIYWNRITWGDDKKKDRTKTTYEKPKKVFKADNDVMNFITSKMKSNDGAN